MRAADPEDIAFACATQLLFDVTDTVDRIACNPLEWDRRGHGACNHSRRKLWFGRKAGIGGHVCGFQASWIVGPFLRKIQRTVDESMTVARNVGREDTDLAVRATVMLSSTVRCIRSEEHTSELQSHLNLVCRLLLDKHIP